MRPPRRVLLGATAVLVAVLAVAYMLPSTSGNGSAMDEGAVVAYSSRVADGAVPHRDFLTFYGPGNVWTVAAAFELFGESVDVERAMGVAYRVVIILALFALGARFAGSVAGALAGAIALVLLTADVIWASAMYGALAFGLAGLVLLVGAARGEHVLALSVAAGVAGGMALLMRFDFAPSVVLSAVPLLGLASVRSRVGYAIGLVGMTATYVPYLAVVGPGRVRRVATDLVSSLDGRRLPLPALTSPAGALLAVTLASTAFMLVAGVVSWRRSRADLRARMLVSVGVFGLGLLPLTLSRADGFHLRTFAVVPLSLLPAILLLAVRTRRAGRPTARSVISLAVVLTSLFVIWDHGQFTYRRLDEAREVGRAYRGFDGGSSGAPARAVVNRTRTLADPGDSLFVGPQDLRRTNYGPTFLYFLLPQLRPASYYMEMNPNTANRAGSRLADELRSADWLILSSEWDDWNEPNRSADYGSDEPNRVVRTSFCPRFEAGQYRLYQRCRFA